jgi:hypothetical protein
MDEALEAKLHFKIARSFDFLGSASELIQDFFSKY